MVKAKFEVNYEEGIEEGDQIGMYFNLGAVDHHLYGKSERLQGVIPLLQRHGDYKIPSIIKDYNGERAGLDRIIQEFFAEYAFVWENELDETIREKIQDYIIMGACLDPQRSAQSATTQCIASTLLCAFAGDDILDTFTDPSSVGFSVPEIKKLFEYVRNILDGVYKNINDVPNTFPAFTTIGQAFAKSQARWIAAIPDYKNKNGPFKQATTNAFFSTALIRQKNPIGERFSEQSHKFFADHQAGMLIFLEGVMLIRGVTMTRELENDLLIYNMRNQFGSVTCLLNTFLGLAKDIKLEEPMDSQILRQVVLEGKTLQDSFDDLFRIMRKQINDLRVGAIKIREHYKDDPNVLEWVRIIEDSVDGQIYAYSQVARYTKTIEFKVVKIQEQI